MAKQVKFAKYGSSTSSIKGEHMKMNDFFRQATLSICGNLEIEKALQSCLFLIREVLPVDIIFLEYYDADYGAMRTIAKATATECSKLDLITPLSDEAKQTAAMQDLPYHKEVFIYKDPQKYAISRELLQFHDITCTDLMVLNLKSNDQVLGALVLITETEMYEEQHADYISLLKEPLIIATANALRHREVLKLKDLLTDDNRYLHGELRRISGDEIIGANFGLKNVMFKVQQVASLDSPVLLLGETGVGKDVIANAIHYSSSRSDGPFVSVNCGAIPETLIDSELFGHEKGAFTGALAQKRGRFERANRGTIFLDEIGELPLQAQVRLLKVLQSKEIERVGGVKTIPLDIRIIAATNRNLEEMVKTGHFREDLWFRLNVFPIWIPPLRDRRSDIPALLDHFIKLKSKELKLPAVPDLSEGEMEGILNYTWPGNVRELQNVVERELILNPRGPLKFANLKGVGHKESIEDMEIIDQMTHLDEIISIHIRRILNKTRGKIHGKGGAAELLGINPSTLRNRMNKLGIDYGRVRK
jgi:transcriptional regulator with GAF, ATPase, and Fis domain